jgi:hypothetical protein
MAASDNVVALELLTGFVGSKTGLFAGYEPFSTAARTYGC